MSKVQLNRPILVAMYGYPGAGKTALARQLSDDLGAAHLQADRIRYELFEDPRYDKRENELINNLMTYMAEEFLGAGVSVVWDGSAGRALERRTLRDLARKTKAQSLVVWLQIDIESAFTRVVNRDRRRVDDKYTRPLDRTSFEDVRTHMQNPTHLDDYVVVSGKHTYSTQKSAINKKLYDLGVISASNNPVTVKPGLVNLIPNPMAGRVDKSRRNIIIR